MAIAKNYHKLIVMRRLLVLCIIFFAIFSLLFNIFMRNVLIQDAQNNLKSETKLIAMQVNNEYAKYKEIVNQLSHNSQVKEFVMAIDSVDSVLEHPRYEEIKQLLKDTNDSDEDASLSWIGINSINSIIYDSGFADLSDEYIYYERPWYIKMIKGEKEIAVSPPYFEAVDQNHVVTLVASINNQDMNIGNIGLDIYINDMKNFVSEISLGEKGEALLITTEGTYIVNPDSWIQSKSIFDNNDPLYVLKDSVLTGEADLKEMVLNKEKVYFYYTKLDIENWIIGGYIPKGEVHKNVNMVNMMSGVMVLSAFMIIMVFNILLKTAGDNKILSKLNQDLTEKEKKLIDNNEEIKNSHDLVWHQKEEIEASYHQLAATEEELRVQYEEIEAYSNRLEKISGQFEMAMNFTNSAIWEYDIKTNKFTIPHGFKGNRNNNLEVMDCLRIDDMIYSEDKTTFWSSLDSYINGKTEELHVQIRVLNEDKGLDWWLIHGKILEHEKHTIRGMLLDITKIKEQEDYIRMLAYIDPLTELPNRRRFIEKLEFAISNNREGAVILLDLDNFKDINDTLGHVYGDLLLKEVSRRLSLFVSEEIFVSRFGGDEFLIIIDDISDKAIISEIIEDIITDLKQPIRIDDNDNEIGVSMGITLYPQDSTDVNQLIMNADVAMYHVKNTGKNRYVYYNHQMKSEILEKSRIEQKIDKALKEGFKLMYQPQIDPMTGRVVSGEALIRFKDESIFPNEFIPIAETTHRIIDIGRWVMEESIQQLHRWQTKGLTIKPIAINFSPKQLMDHGFVEYYKELLEQYDIEAKYIEFEITESIFLTHKEETIDFLNQIRSIGSKIALDDFGTGYSSLSYLTFLPVDSVKLDKSLCDRFVEVKDLHVMKSLISLVQGLNLLVVAEGIETYKQVELLMQLECDLIQGYYYSKPVDHTKYESYLDKIFD